MPGYEVVNKLEKMGWHAGVQPVSCRSPTSRSPDENLLGGENEGFRLIMANFQWG